MTMLDTRVIGRTERALGALMDGILDRTGGTFPQWIVLTMTTAAASRDRDGATLRRALIEGPRLSPAHADELLAEMVRLGLLEPVADDRPVRLTESGRAHHDTVRAAVNEVTAQVFGGLDPDDMAVAGRVLTVITARATALADRHTGVTA